MKIIYELFWIIYKKNTHDIYDIMPFMDYDISLKKQMQIRFSILMVLIFFILISVLTVYLGKILVENTTDYTGKIVNSISSEVDLHLMRINDLLTVAADNSLFSNASERSKADYAWRAVDFLHTLILDHPEIQDVILLNKVGYAVIGTGKPIHQEYNFYQQPWVYTRYGTGEKSYFLDPHNENYYLHGGGDRDVVSILFPLPEQGSSNLSQAALLCNVNSIELEQLTRDLIPVKNSRITIYDRIGKSLFSRKVSLPVGKMITVNAVSPLTGWNLVASIPQMEILKDIRALFYLFLIIMITAVIVTIITASRISMKISQPIESMASKMREIGNGNFTLSLFDSHATVEIASLGKEIDIMIGQITEYQQRIGETQLFALQEQINPHFLFNTLQTIQSLTVQNQQRDIRRVTTLLGEILRYSMYNPWELVSLSSEFSYVEKYLEIQSYRFPGQFTYSIDCPEELKSSGILKLLIQPIVENSINHGFNGMENRHIAMTVHKEESGIVIIVADNGHGMDQVSLDEIKEKLQTATIKNSQTIGLQNVHERIILKFGRYFGLEIQTTENIGCSVLMHLPIYDPGENT